MLNHLNFLSLLLLSTSVHSLRFGLLRLRSSHSPRLDLISLLSHLKNGHGQAETEAESPKASSDVFENGVHDAENVFHLLKELPHDCFTYVRTLFSTININ